MKYLKVFLVIILAMFTFGSAMAQVVVRARVGGPAYHHRYHHYHRHYVHHHYYHHN